MKKNIIENKSLEENSKLFLSIPIGCSPNEIKSFHGSLAYGYFL